ncbi:MAG: threonine aldolase [Ktedonobacterales bacterium]|nr:threonine aldolase [Ktedonobacterales bacterium]
MDTSEIDQVRNESSRFLMGHHRKRPHQMLTEIAASIAPDATSDAYGQGQLITDFEQEIATLLGKEAAVFMPSGTMAQQIALRIWAGRTGKHRVAFHPTCHLELFEQQGYRELHHLQGVLVGNPAHMMTLADLQAINQPLAALLIELPQREIGGQLPTWEDLTAMTDWARAQGLHLHLDGARLWQCHAFYQRSYAEIAGLFESVYVSFYKDLGGIAGAVLAGPKDFIAEARVWQRRHGGNLYQLYPFVLAAKMGLHQHLPHMDTYVAKTQAIAAALTTAQLPHLAIVPNPPQTNMMHVFLRGEREAIMQAALEASRTSGIFMVPGLQSTRLPDQFAFEWTVGAATLDVTDEEIVGFFRAIFAQTT